MDSVITTFLLFIAAIVALLSYLIIPRVPVVALVSGAAITLAAGVWWHWTQFSVDYRLSTWQEQLRNYGSFIMVLLVILLSYGFYAVGFTGGGSTASPVQESPKTNFLSDVTSSPSNMFTGTEEEEEEEEEESTPYNPPPPPKRNFVNPAVMPNLAPKPPTEEGGLINAMKNFNPLQ